MSRPEALKIGLYALLAAMLISVVYLWPPPKRVTSYETSRIQQKALGEARPIVAEPMQPTADVPYPLGWADRAERSAEEALRAGQLLCADPEGTLYVAPQC